MGNRLSAVVAALLAATALAPSASAQGMYATGSCGERAGVYGTTDVNAGEVNSAGETVPALYYKVDYSGVPAPTMVGVIVRYNDELESHTGLQTFTAQSSGGSYEGAVRANIQPEAQGFANSIDAGRRGRADGPPNGGVGRLQNSGTQGGVPPGEYVFYVYTGAMVDTPQGRMFMVDEKSYLGRFSCGVSTEQGSGPG